MSYLDWNRVGSNDIIRASTAEQKVSKMKILV